LDRAIDAMRTVGSGLTQAMETLKALQSETFDFAVNLPDRAFGQSVPNLANEIEPL